MKKLLSVLSSTLQGGVRGGLLFLLFFASAINIYASDTQVNGIWYDFDSGTKTASVTYLGSAPDSYRKEYSGSVVIPETVTYNGTTYSVKSIGYGAFAYCSSLTSVTIPNSVTSIGERTFYGCSSLTSVTINSGAIVSKDYSYDDNISHIFGSQVTEYIIGESVTSIGDYAFSGCSSLISVTIGNSVTSIGENAFNSCSSLTKTNYTGDIAGWCNIMFGSNYANPMYCSHNFYINDQEIKDLVIPNSVTSIGSYAFNGCSSLTAVTIPNSVISIGGSAFYDCSSLTKTNYTGDIAGWCNIKFYSGSANPMYCSHNFYINDQEIKDLVIPNSVTSIGGSAFYGCSSLTSVTIPNSVTSIGAHAFNSCSSLTSMTIPNSVTSIGSSAFKGCSSLTAVTIPNSVISIGEEAFYGCSSLTKTIYIGDIAGWCNIMFGSNYANPMFCSHNFYINDQEIKDLVIPNNVTSIGSYAFSYCYSLTSVTIGESVTSIGEDAFVYCFSLTSVTIPNSVTSIGSSAFKDCSSLTSITIPNSVTSIGEKAFYRCYSLTSMTIPNSVTSIGEDAFKLCSSLTSVTINSDAIVNKAYSSDSNISHIFGSQVTEYIIGESVTSIGDYAFSGCSKLTSVTIPNSVTSIGERTFYGCSSLTAVTIPNSVISIGGSAFYDCSSLTKTNYTGDIADWCNIKFYSGSANPMYCSHNFYINDQEIKDLVIPNSVTSIGGSAFYGCSSLTSVTIPNSVTSIGAHAFNSCSSLTSMTIPNSVTSIGSSAFKGCSSLTSITCEAETPPTVGQYAFDGVSISIPVYVPCGCVEAYKAASDWEDFTNFQEPLAYSIEVNVNDTIMGTAKVDYNTFCGGNQISATPNFGYHFVQWNDGNTENPRTLELTQDTILTAEFAQSFSGQCGDNLYWSYDETTKTVSITSSGKMYDYTADTQPWLLFKEQIKEVTTTNTVTSIGTSAFEGCARLSKVSLGTGLEEIAANAFAGCTRLYDIYVYATYPPFADESSFANYNVYVYIPCEYQRDYILDVVWGKFKFIECIESEDVTTDGVVITPSTNDVTITWPTEGNADTYTIVIKKGDTVFCTLTFNADGQLLNIAFAPGRNGNHPVQYAEQAVNGYRFTVTGLTEATQYVYNITTKDAANKTIATYSGEFTTMGGATTDMDNIQSPMTNCQKIIRNGQLLIFRDGVEYTIMGAEVK